MSGHVVFSSTANSFMPNAIRFITRSQWSHCLITTPDYLGRKMCIEAAGIGIAMVDFDLQYRQSKTQKFEVYEVLIPEIKKLEGMYNVLSYLQQPYAYLAYPWFLWRWFLNLFKKDIKHRDNWYPHLWVCSGFTRRYLEHCGLGYLTSMFGRGSMHAQDLYEIVKRNPDIFKLIEVQK